MTRIGFAVVDELRQAVLGPVLVADDPGYDDVRMAWNGRFDRRPEIIARCMGVADVQAVVAFAQAQGLRLAVRGGSHSVQGSSTTDGGLLLDLSLLRGVRVDPVQRTAVAAGGTLWSEFDRETNQVHGLASTGGMISHTGIAGLTLGGGVGRLMRKHGLTVDNVLGLDIVTADGQWRHVDADSHPDLFWALRGGGGDFGVVTHFEYQLHPLPRTLFGGALGWPIEQTREVLAAVREEVASAPDELYVSFLMTVAQDVPFVPVALRHKPVLMMTATWMGEDPAEGERRFAPFRERVTPAIDLLAPLPYTFLQASADATVPHGRRAFSHTGFFEELTDEILDVLLARVAEFPTLHCVIELDPLGGAIARVPDDATAAAGFRTAKWYVTLGANAPDASADEICRDWVLASDAAIAPFRAPGRYINFLLENDEATLREAYGEEKYARLQEIKAKYDPDGVFRRDPDGVAVTA